MFFYTQYMIIIEDRMKMSMWIQNNAQPKNDYAQKITSSYHTYLFLLYSKPAKVSAPIRSAVNLAGV